MRDVSFGKRRTQPQAWRKDARAHTHTHASTHERTRARTLRSTLVGSAVSVFCWRSERTSIHTSAHMSRLASARMSAHIVPMLGVAGAAMPPCVRSHTCVRMHPPMHAGAQPSGEPRGQGQSRRCRAAGPYSCGPCSYGQNSYGPYSYGLYSHTQCGYTHMRVRTHT